MSATTQQTPTQSNTLSPVQVQALDLLLQGLTITEAARQLNINRCTIHEWSRNHSAFISAFHAARQRHQADVLDRFHTLAAPALQLLEGILTNQDAPDSIRLRAALAVLKSIETNGPAMPFTPRQEAQINQFHTQAA